MQRRHDFTDAIPRVGRALALAALLLPAAACKSAAPDAPDGKAEARADAPLDASMKAASSHSKPGFVTVEEDGRLWVFREGAPELAAFRRDGDLAKHVVRPGAGPLGKTLKAPDSETILAYVGAKPGFVVEVEDGRLWVFREGAQELAAFRRDGDLAKHVVRPGAGPLGTSLKAPDSETIAAYLAAAP